MPLGRDLQAPLGSTLPLLSSMFFFCVSFQIPHLFLSVFVRVYLRIEFLTDRNFVMQFDCHRRAIHDHSSLFLSLCLSLCVSISALVSVSLRLSLSPQSRTTCLHRVAHWSSDVIPPEEP